MAIKLSELNDAFVKEGWAGLIASGAKLLSKATPFLSKAKAFMPRGVKALPVPKVNMSAATQPLKQDGWMGRAISRTANIGNSFKIPDPFSLAWKAIKNPRTAMKGALGLTAAGYVMGDPNAVANAREFGPMQTAEQQAIAAKGNPNNMQVSWCVDPNTGELYRDYVDQTQMPNYPGASYGGYGYSNGQQYAQSNQFMPNYIPQQQKVASVHNRQKMLDIRNQLEAL